MCLSVLFRCFGAPSFIRNEPVSLGGEFGVSFVRGRVPLPNAGSVRVSVFYPTSKVGDSGGGVPYWSRDQVLGLADYSKQPPFLFRHLESVRHPCNPEGAPVATPPEGTSWPVVIFSHGLAGNSDMYTQVLRCLSSKGYIVAALEHEDGSGSFATRAGTGETILYKRPDDTPYSREKVVSFRKSFLEHRVKEVAGFWAKNIGVRRNLEPPSAVPSGPEDVLAMFGDSTRVSLIGHSFGGATMALVTQHLDSLSTGGSAATTMSAECVVMWDPWAFTLAESELEVGVRCPRALSVLSEAWLTNNELPQIETLLRSSTGGGGVASYYLPGTTHQSFSDSPLFFPSFIAERLGMKWRGEVPADTHRALAKAAHTAIETAKETRSSGGGSGGGDFPLAFQKQSMKTFEDGARSISPLSLG